MPYLQQEWVKLLQPPDAERQQTGSLQKVLRTIPHDSKNKGAPSGDTKQEAKPDPNLKVRAQCMSNIVRSRTEELYNNNPAESTEGETFFRYSINASDVIFCGKYSNIYLAQLTDKSNEPLIARVFEPTSKIDPHRSMYLKTLKQIGSDHEELIRTWGIYFDANMRVVVFQEFAQYGNLQEYLKQHNVIVPEHNVREWAQQLLRGMDFLGDLGMCHRAISPKHVLLVPGPNEQSAIAVKLGSFRDAVIYFDPNRGTFRNQPCRPLEKRSLANYQAPETFGLDTEEFDPIVADVWSYGATLFLAVNRLYPFHYKESPPDIALDIQETIDQSNTLSVEAKRWFSGILAGDATKRTTIDMIAADPWFDSHPQA